LSILTERDTKVLVQNITGREGGFHTLKMLEYGTKIPGGVAPGKGGMKMHGVPVFNSVSDAVKYESYDASVIFVPAPAALDAIMEAGSAGIKLIICITEGIPVRDSLKAYEYIKKNNISMIGPNCPGIISPGKSKIGIMPGYIHKEGKIGIISRSGTLTYEIVYLLTQNGLGQSTCVGLGGDPVAGSSFIDILKLMEADRDTELIIMIGEIGGRDEEEAADYIKANMKTPVITFIAGQTAPPGKRMGHAGAIISGGGEGSAVNKISYIRGLGMDVADFPFQIPEIIKRKYKVSE